MREKLFEPIVIGGIHVPNRVVRLAAGLSLSNPDQTVSEPELNYFEELAKNEIGLIVHGALRIDEEWASYLPNEPAIYDDRFLPGLKALTERIHRYDSKVFFQLWHPGQVEYALEEGKRFCRMDEFTEEDMARTIRKYKEAAVRAVKAGADGIEIQICHNYLLEQFVSPALNTRTDVYSAATVENAMRFPMRVLEGIREACPALPLIIKINGSDFLENGVDPTYMSHILPYLERVNTALITVSGGGELSEVTGMSGDGRKMEGWKVGLAQEIKQHTSLPVCATGSIRHPNEVERILTETDCEMVGIARGFVADPEWLTKVKEGREEEIRYCISCLHCLDGRDEDGAICSANPRVGFCDRDCTLKKDGAGRCVCVVGAGPGGLEAAITLAKRGFHVVVFEKEGRVGGSVNLACRPSGREKLRWVIDSMEKQAEQAGVEIRLNHEVSAEELISMRPYAVVIAAGCSAVTAKIEGLELPFVLKVRKVLREKPYFHGKKIVVIGAGLTGEETATTYAEAGNTVTVLDMIPKIPVEIGGLDGILQNGYAEKAGVNFVLNHKLTKVTEGHVHAEDLSTGVEKVFDADIVIDAMGVKPDRKLLDALTGATFPVLSVGDVNKRAFIRTAVKEGFFAARNLK